METFSSEGRLAMGAVRWIDSKFAPIVVPQLVGETFIVQVAALNCHLNHGSLMVELYLGKSQGIKTSWQGCGGEPGRY